MNILPQCGRFSLKFPLYTVYITLHLQLQIFLQHISSVCSTIFKFVKYGSIILIVLLT